MAKKAIIVGSNGQDGLCLGEFLAQEKYELTLLSRKSGINIADPGQVQLLIKETQPDEIYFLAAHHHSSDQKLESEFELWEKSFSTHSIAAEVFLESIRLHSPHSRFFFASSSLVFGNQGGVLNESNSLRPDSPYAISKVAGMSICDYYRKKYGVFASVGILFNHESEYRGNQFLTKKIAKAVSNAQKNASEKLTLGDLSAQVDWGYARDYVRAMNLILKLEAPDDFIISSGTLNSVEDLVRIAYRKAGLDYRDHVVENSGVLLRKIPSRLGDFSKLNRMTGWTPSTGFDRLIEIILQSEGVQLV